MFETTTKKRIGEFTFSCGVGTSQNKQLPIVIANVNGKQCKCLVDTGCTHSIISYQLINLLSVCGTFQRIQMLNGSKADVSMMSSITLEVENLSVNLDCLVMEILSGVDLILGLDAINKLGGVTIVPGNNIHFENAKKEQELDCLNENICTGINEKSIQLEKTNNDLFIDDSDFSAYFDGEQWVVAWKWKNEPPSIAGCVPNYKVSPEDQHEFDEEVEHWIANGWLMPVVGDQKANIPLMAVKQVNKKKVRPVLDFRSLNKYVENNTAESVVCDETLRNWRKKKGPVKLLDLKKAYLQLRVKKEFWEYQVVRFKGRNYYLTRLGFGLCCAPKIMNAVLRKVLSLHPKIHQATDNYIDDIIIDETIISAEEVKDHLLRFGLVAKPPEDFDNARVLGLQVSKEVNGTIRWSRSNCIPDINNSKMSKREVFSVCGHLVGHYPVASWLRIACSFIKRSCNDVKWDHYAGDRAIRLLKELYKKLEEHDPVNGVWHASPKGKVELWCDASSIAYGVALCVDGEIIEDAAWLRKENDHAHINVAELDAVMKGINLTIKWGIQSFTIYSDSATVHGWINSLLTKNRRINVSGVSEMLVKRRLSIMSELISDYQLNISISLVKSEKNKADILTRVSKSWLCNLNNQSEIVTENDVEHVNLGLGVNPTDEEKREIIENVHKKFHGGINKTLFVAKRIHPDKNLLRDEVQSVVKNCPACLSIDPNPIIWENGDLSCKRVWSRIAIDVVHYGGKKYLSLIDCGPSKYAIWRLVSDETSEVILRELRKIFCEFGPPDQLLLDNYSSFVSEKFSTELKKWNVDIYYRCVNKPSGNSIIERNHRTVKRCAARSKCNIKDAVFWYNVTPRVDGVIPAHVFFNRCFRFPEEKANLSDLSNFIDTENKMKVGEKVFVKPLNARCTDKWEEGTITRVPENKLTLEVDGSNQHLSRIRKVPMDNQGLEVHTKNDSQRVSQENNEWITVGRKGRPVRSRSPPNRYGVKPY